MPGGSGAQDQTPTTNADDAVDTTQRDDPLGRFRVWLTTELREAGCEIRTLSPEGMARITVERFAREGWQVIPPAELRETLDLVVDATPDTEVEDRLHELLRAEGYFCPDHPEATR